MSLISWQSVELSKEDCAAKAGTVYPKGHVETALSMMRVSGENGSLSPMKESFR